MIDEIVSNPFPGLRPFEEDEDYLFFGREKQVDELLKKLRKNRFLVVVGASGSGKSSLVKCGLLPSLHGGMMSGAGFDWSIITFRPGSYPIFNMAEAIAKSGLYHDQEDPDDASNIKMNTAIIETALRRNNRGLSDTIKRSKKGNIPKKNFLILVDQFEELFRFNQIEKSENKPQRDSKNFIDLLLQASVQEGINIYVTFTMRSEFLGDCTEFKGLPGAINKGQYLVPRLSRDELKDTITGPMSIGGAEISSRLLNRLLNDVGENPDQLPILQHALMRTWDNWQKNNSEDTPLDLPNYDAIGTMTSALSIHAEEAYSELANTKERDLCERLFKSLTEKNKKNHGTRRPAKLDQLVKATSGDKETVMKIIDVFRNPERSFIVPPTDVELYDDSIIDISHESLMRVWERLINWVDDETESFGIYNKLCEAALEYQKGLTSLWVDPELQVALNWRDKNEPNVTWASRYNPFFEQTLEYLEHCENERELEKKKKELAQQLKMRRTRIFTIILGVATLVTLVFAMISISLKFKADENAIEATNQRKQALKEKKFAQVQQQLAEEQRKVADKQRKRAVKQELLAEVRRKEAEFQKNIAEIEITKAIKQRQLAIRSQKIAENQEEIANTERFKAVKEKKISDSLKIIAEIIEANTARLRFLDISRKLATYSSSVVSEISPTLALQAYKFNKLNDGYEYEPVIYKALSNVTNNKKILLNNSPYRFVIPLNNQDFLVLEESGVIQKVNINSNQIENFLDNSLINARKLIHYNNVLIISNASKNIMLQNIKSNKKKIIEFVNSNPTIQDNNLVYISNGKLIFENLLTFQQEKEVTLELQDVIFLESINNNEFIFSNKHNKLYRFNAKTGKSSHLLNFEKKINTMAIDKQSETVAIGLVSGELILFPINKPNDIVELNTHSFGINSIVFSKNSQFILTTSFDFTVKLTNRLALDKEPLTIDNTGKWVWNASFMNDDQKIIVVNSNNTVSSYSTMSHQLVEKLCNNFTRELTQEEWGKYIGHDIPVETACGN